MTYIFFQNGHSYVHTVPGQAGFRLLAHPTQVPLIQRYQQTGAPVEVCSVNQFTSDTPADVLQQMSNVTALGRVGGWRELRGFEKTALQFSFEAEGKTLANLPEHLFELLKEHPLIRAGITFAFGSGSIHAALVRLMTTIYDIRRFADQTGKDNANHLRSYFRVLTPAGFFRMARKSEAQEPFGDVESRASAIHKAWFENEFGYVPFNDLMPNPRAFLYREYVKYLQEYKDDRREEEQAKLLAVWRVSVRFLEFVRRLWLSKVEGCPFRPERFFLQQDEQDAFAKYRPDDPEPKIVLGANSRVE